MSAFGRTLVEWAEAATVHGVQYVFTAGQVLTVLVNQKNLGQPCQLLISETHFLVGEVPHCDFAENSALTFPALFGATLLGARLSCWHCACHLFRRAGGTI